jgi:hypothetical protein
LVQNKFLNVSNSINQSRRTESGWVLPLEKMAECGQRPNTVADDLGNRQHRHREDYARNAPHPETVVAGRSMMLWLLGVTAGIAVLAILAVDKLEGQVRPRKQPAIYWDAFDC